MKCFKDEKTGLVFVSPEVYENEYGDYVTDDEQTFEGLYKELDEWNGKGIKTYISKNEKLGEFLKKHRNIKRTHYFIFDQGELSATALVETKALLTDMFKVKGYVEYCKKQKE